MADQSTNLKGIPFVCNFEYIQQGVIDEVEVVLAPLFLGFLLQYSFYINLSWYIPKYRFEANMIKATWLQYMEVFEGLAYFQQAQVEVFRLWNLENLVCDPIMWRFWLFHLLAYYLPNFELIDSDVDPTIPDEEVV